MLAAQPNTRRWAKQGHAVGAKKALGAVALKLRQHKGDNKATNARQTAKNEALAWLELFSL
jgi:hypothetical protein